ESCAGKPLTQLPEAAGSDGIDRSRAHAMQLCRVVGRKCASDLAVGAIDAAHAIKLRTCGAPHACRRALLRRLFVILRIDDGLAGLVEDLAAIDFCLGHVTDQVCHNASRMYRKSTDAPALADRIERDGKQRVGSLGLPIGDPGIVLAVLEIGIMKVDAGPTVR